MSGKMANGPQRSYRTNHLSSEQRDILKAYIKSNPDSTFAQFEKDIKGKVKCSDSYYYYVKRDVSGPSKRAYTRRDPNAPTTKASKSPVYMTIWSYPTEDFNDGARKILKDFVETLNASRRSRFQIIEMKDPSIVEIRETHFRA